MQAHFFSALHQLASAQQLTRAEFWCLESFWTERPAVARQLTALVCDKLGLLSQPACILIEWMSHIQW